MNLSQDLQNAVDVGDVQHVRNLLQNNIVNLRAPENVNLLWLAIARDRIEIIEMLIRAGADLAIDDYDDNEFSILHDLVRKSENDNQDYAQLALLALDYGADMNARDDEGESVLEFAVFAQSTILIRELIRRGAQLNNDNILDVIMQVADFENADEVLPLLFNSYLIGPEARTRQAVSAINAHLGSPTFKFHVFEHLLQMIVDVNELGTDGDTMLVAAARYGKMAVVTTLLARGADINKKTTRGEIPLYAASSSSSSLMTKLLISQGATIHDCNDDGKYPIHGACSSSSVENLLYLLSHGASVNVRDNNGKYPIHIACSNSNGMVKEIIHLLLSIGTPINVTDGEGNTPFSLTGRERNPLTFNMSNILFVKKLALLYATTGAVRDSDLTIVKTLPVILGFFETCCNELQVASQTMVFENFNLLTLLATSAKKLSIYLRNPEFTDAIGNCIQRQGAQFPIYLKQFRMALQIARKIRDIVKYTENMLQESLPVPLPYLAIEKIAHYMLTQDFIRTELTFYSLLYMRIDAEGLDFIKSAVC